MEMNTWYNDATTNFRTMRNSIEITTSDGETFVVDMFERNGEVEAWIGETRVEGGPGDDWFPSEIEGPAYDLWMQYVAQFE